MMALARLPSPHGWLQLVTTDFFAWGVFFGMAAATRRIDHLNLVEITKRMTGPRRSALEIFLVTIAFTALFPQVVLYLPKLLLPESVGCFKNPSGSGYICPK